VVTPLATRRTIATRWTATLPELPAFFAAITQTVNGDVPDAEEMHKAVPEYAAQEGLGDVIGERKQTSAEDPTKHPSKQTSGPTETTSGVRLRNCAHFDSTPEARTWLKQASGQIA
jgi:hypothetical protein